MRDMESCHQYLVSNIDIDQSQMVMYVGKQHAPGGYLWIFPKGDKHANIGIGITGIAGPGGATRKKKVGEVYVSLCHFYVL